jgi:hypothetical protein
MRPPDPDVALSPRRDRSDTLRAAFHFPRRSVTHELLDGGLVCERRSEVKGMG